MTEAISPSIIPQNESYRLDALRRYKVLETPVIDAFNNIAGLMAKVFNMPIALVSLVDKERVFFKGNIGMTSVNSADRNYSLCSFAILSSEPTVFDDPLSEPCLLTNPLVQGEFGLRFYAGAPLVTPDGFNIGSVCVVDKKERSFSIEQQEMLKHFAKLVMQHIELRQAAMMQKEAEEELINSKERFELVSKATQDAVWDWDLKTNKIWWNEGFKAIFGYQINEIEPSIDSWYNRIHPEDKDRVVKSIHAVIDSTEKNWLAEYRFCKADGTYAFVLDRGYAIHSRDGKTSRMLGSIQDITKRKNAEAALSTQAQLVQTIANNTTSALFMMNKEGYCTFINATGERLFGYSAADLRAKPMHDLIHHHHVDGSPYPREECPLELALNNSKPIKIDRELFFKKDRTSFTGACSASPIFENGVSVSAVIEIRDVTLEVEAEQMLRRGAAELEQMVQERTRELWQVNEQLKQFSYAASHDLQEPLRKISVFVDRLLNNLGPSLSEENKRLTDRIQSTASRMRILINDLLTYSNTTQSSATFVPVELSTIVKEVLDDIEVTIQEKSATVELMDLPRLKGHPRQLRQLFQNLISNSLKYQKQHVEPVVRISSKLVQANDVVHLPIKIRDGAFYLIEVKDNGIGFDPEYAKQIFSLFQRLHRKEEYEGTGVGLAIVQKVVENHHGYIWADSKPGEGATFVILLPAE